MLAFGFKVLKDNRQEEPQKLKIFVYSSSG
jgi:hypothetical protein